MFNFQIAPASCRPHRVSMIALLLLLLFVGPGCDDDPMAPTVDDPGSVDVEGIEVHGGDLGLVLDTREIFRKGYAAATAEVSFASHSERNAVLPIDPVTNLAILSLDTDILTTEEEEAFNQGVALQVTVLDEDGQPLGQFSDDAIKLENTNVPIVVNTSLPALSPPVALRQDLPYLIQVEGSDGVLTWGSSNNATGAYTSIDLLENVFAMAWGDYDNDGDLDLLCRGDGSPPSALIFQNNLGVFEATGPALAGDWGPYAWKDYDNDGDLDAFTGDVIHRNDGGIFTQSHDLGLYGIHSLDLGDVDGDHDLDILVTGWTEASSPYIRIYRFNHITGDFEIHPTGESFPPSVQDGSAAWGDFNQDSLPDILLTGRLDDGTRIARIYTNDLLVFTEENVDLVGVDNSVIAWGDIDNDGYQDIVYSGETQDGQHQTFIYENFGGALNPAGGFSHGPHEGVGSISLGDYDNDGDLDIVLTTQGEGGGVDVRVYQNRIEGFVDIDTVLLYETAGGGLARWGDCDGDGNLDVFVSYLSGNTRNTRVFRADVFDIFDSEGSFTPDDENQEYMFLPVEGQENTYTLEMSGEAEGRRWCLPEDTSYLAYQIPDPGSGEPVAEFEAVPDEDGWTRLRLAGTDEFLVCRGGYTKRLAVSDDEAHRFRLISANIDWVLSERGTVYNQPIMPPARLDFAYRGSLFNCSSSTLEDQVGRSEQRGYTSTTGSSESLQIFSSTTNDIQLTLGFEVMAKIGLPAGAGAEVTKSFQLQFNHQWSSSETAITESNWSTSESSVVEVSRTRTLTLRPYTAVEVYDTVKTITNVRVPYTQVLRIRATNMDTNEPLTGNEIRSQMLFNFVGGVITDVEDEYVDIGFRGEVLMDKLMHATTVVNEVEDACQ